MDYSYSYNYDMNPAASGAMIAGMGIYIVVCLAISVVMIIALWKLFSKAGEPGWACLVPFYNTYVLFKIAMGNGWLFLLMFVPVANIVMEIIVLFKLAKAYGQGVGFGFGLLFLSPIFLLILAFGSAEYVGA